MLIRTIDTGYPTMSNCYLLFDEESKEAAVVDPAAYDEKSELDAVLAELGCKLKYIMLTHGHFDHLLGTKGVKKSYPEALVCIHGEDAPRLKDKKLSLAAANGLAHLQKPVAPDVLLKDGDILTLGGTGISVMHTPGHTPGGVCYIIESEKTIVSGDTLFCRTVGRTDFEGGNVEALKASLRRLLALDGNYRVLPGHNIETTLDSERVRNIFIRRM